MKSFNDLRNFALKKAEKGQMFYVVKVNGKSITMQIYSSTNPIQANMSVDSEQPVIKFEERTKGKITVAVSYHDNPEIIGYGRSKDFDVDDHLYKLLEVFPEGVNISIIVAALLSI